MSESPLVQTAVSNAFTVLAEEEAYGDRQVAEALLLTFNADLGFFESRLLGLLRATGARITVLGDATMWRPDQRAVRHAGRSYYFGLVEARAAFHPKLMLLVGEKRAVATVGSGNLTMGGWQYNSELLTVFTGDNDTMPAAFVDLRNLLSHLGESGDLDPVANAAVQRTVSTLDGLLRGAELVDTGHRIHASWDGALVERLPTGPVRELRMSAAFHDPASAAVDAILERLRPRHVQVAVQPGWTHLDPVRLATVLSRYADTHGATFELLHDQGSAGQHDTRYRHGKLIEWTTEAGARHALTGSPNLSRSALLSDRDNGGNHEVAVVGPIETTLFPGGTPIAVADIPTLLPGDEDRDDEPAATPAVRVSLAERDPTGESTKVLLNRAPTDPVRIEVSLLSDSPDHWTHLGDASQGRQVHEFPGQVPAGSRIRAVTTDATGTRRATEPVYVTDLDRVLTRVTSTKHTSRTHRAVATDLLGADVEFLDSLHSDLVAFARDLQSIGAPPQTREADENPTAPDHTREPEVAEPWLWLQDDTTRRHGTGIASWLLALPRLHDSGASGVAVPWADKIKDDTEVGLEIDDTDSATQEVLDHDHEPAAAGTDTPDHRADAERLRAHRRGWVTKAVRIAPEVPLPSRLLILRLTLAFWSAGNWADGDPEPFDRVVDLMRTLTLDASQPEELHDRVSALAAIALTVMRQRADLATTDKRTLRCRDAARLAGPLLRDLSEDLITTYTAGLKTGHGGSLVAGHVQDSVADLVLKDPLAALHNLMEERGYVVTRPAPNQVHIRGGFSTPEQIALDAVGVAEEADGVAVWAFNPDGHWTLVVWRRPDLVTINHRAITRWRHQRLTLMGPAAVATALRQNGPGGLPNVVSKNHPTQSAWEVLASAGVAGLPKV